MRYMIVAILLISACNLKSPTSVTGTSVAEVQQGLICDPDCDTDPAGAQYVINQVLHWGGAAGWHTTQGNAGCQWWGVVGGYDIECYATFEDSSGHRHLVDCTQHPSGGGFCDSIPACDQFGC